MTPDPLLLLVIVALLELAWIACSLLRMGE